MSNTAAQWSVAVFAHNVDSTIRDCINCVLDASSDNALSVYVLTNGCRDATEEIVREIEQENDAVHLIHITMADKSNAWNHYVHQIAPSGAMHFFIDGDVEIQPDALLHIADTLSKDDRINAVGGAPLVGRDKQGWTERMIKLGRVSGGLYALSDEFVHRLRAQKTKIPIGFIGEDFLVSAIAKNMLSEHSLHLPSPLLRIDARAGFSFRQLSLLRITDYLSYFRRLVRYRLRDYQLFMLFNFADRHPGSPLPESVDDLYAKTPHLPGYYWRGKQTLIDWIAVFRIRRAKRSGS